MKFIRKYSIILLSTGKGVCTSDESVYEVLSKGTGVDSWHIADNFAGRLRSAVPAAGRRNAGRAESAVAFKFPVIHKMAMC